MNKNETERNLYLGDMWQQADNESQLKKTDNEICDWTTCHREDHI